MHHNPAHPCNPDHASPQDEWIDALLRRDAKHAATCSDPEFVTSVMAHLGTPAYQTRARPMYSLTAWAFWLLLGFEVLAVAALCLSAPDALKAWMSFAAAPLNLSALLQPKLLDFLAGTVMVIMGAIELSREDHEHTRQAWPS
jgi:hypothetical protein